MLIADDLERRNNPPVAVGPRVRVYGVEAPGKHGQTYDWRWAKGPENTAGIEPEYEVMGFREMIARRFNTDAHFVPYLVLGPDGLPMARQPRVNKGGLPWVLDQGRKLVVRALIIDIDNPGKKGWNPPDYERVAVEHATVPLLQTCAVYSTRNGRRLVQPLARDIEDMDTFERTQRAYMLALEESGVIGVDFACSDWTRVYRVARCVRDGLFEPPHLKDLSKCVPIEPPTPVEVVPRQRKAPKGTAKDRPIAEPKWSPEVPLNYRALVAEVADVIVTIDTEWHPIFLALGGALLERGVPPEHIPAIVTGISVESKRDTATSGRYAGAQTTVRRWQDNRPFKGMGTLQKTDPRLVRVIVKHTLTAPEQRVEGQAEAAREEAVAASPLEVATTGMRRAIREAYGLVALEAGCGLGKSRAGLDIAEERSKKTHKNEEATSDRAPPGSKTGITVPTHQLAIQHTENLRKRGVAVMRVFGPLSVMKPDGTPECHYHEQGKALAAGGQSVSWEFCSGREKNRCDRWETCKARDGIDADEGARVVVGTHQKVASVAAEIGPTGLMLIDEPPDPVVDVAITLRGIESYLACENDFVPTYWAVTYPLVLAARAVLQSDVITSTDQAHTTSTVLSLGWPKVPEAVIREALETAGDDAPLEGTDTMARVFAVQPLALHEEAKGDAPRLRWQSTYRARGVPALAAKLGAASGLVRALWRSATQQPEASLRVTETKGTRTLVCALIDRDYVEALKRGGPTVMLDANLTLQHAIAQRIVEAPVPKHRFVAPDGATVTRELWLEPKARRKHWLTPANGGPRWPVWEKGPLRAIQCIVDEVKARGLRNVAIITVLPVAKCLRVALGEPGDHGVPSDIADEAVRLLAPVLAGVPGVAWKLGHYGAMRGLDSMMACDGLFTLIDPIPDLGMAQHRAPYYALDIPWERYVEILCAAELEQAQGRGRCPHRITPLYAAHIGSTLPGGYGWDSPDVAVLRTRLRQVATAMGAEELIAIKGPRTMRAFAAAVGIHEDAMSLYLNGKRPVPLAVATLLRLHAATLPTGGVLA